MAKRRNKTTRRSRKRIEHCKSCKEGRLIRLKSKDLVFCGFCGKEF